MTHVAVTDSATRFSVGDEVVEVDPFLEAYDDEAGPLLVDVQVPGKIATIGIEPDAVPHKRFQQTAPSSTVSSGGRR